MEAKWSCRARQRKVESDISRQLKRNATVLGRMGSREETGMIAILHIFAVRLENARSGPGLGKDFTQHGQIETERFAQAEAFREARGVDVHHHVN